MTTVSRCSPHTRRKRWLISPSVTLFSTHSTITGIRLSVPSAADLSLLSRDSAFAGYPGSPGARPASLAAVRRWPDQPAAGRWAPAPGRDEVVHADDDAFLLLNLALEAVRRFLDFALLEALFDARPAPRQGPSMVLM